MTPHETTTTLINLPFGGFIFPYGGSALLFAQVCLSYEQESASSGTKRQFHTRSSSGFARFLHCPVYLVFFCVCFVFVTPSTGNVVNRVDVKRAPSDGNLILVDISVSCRVRALWLSSNDGTLRSEEPRLNSSHTVVSRMPSSA